MFYLYYTADNIGSTALLTNQAGEKHQKFLYTPFGEMWKESGDPATTRLFTGQMYDKEIGHYYYNTRFYDPHLGVFTRPDPAMDGLNHYGYVHGNPINYTDPTGMTSVAEPSFWYQIIPTLSGMWASAKAFFAAGGAEATATGAAGAKVVLLGGTALGAADIAFQTKSNSSQLT